MTDVSMTGFMASQTFARRLCSQLGYRLRVGLLGLGLLALASSGCIAENMLKKPVAIEEHKYDFNGEHLAYYEATLSNEKGVSTNARPAGYATSPVVLFVEGDGSECQSYSQAAWFRFLVSYTGHYVFVRPKAFVNATCGTDKWKKADFDSRVDEVGLIVEALKTDHPGQPIILMGHSAGAHVAALYVESHPDQILAIVNLAGGVDDLERVMKQSEREKHLGAKALGENERNIDAAIEHLKSPDPDKPLWGRTEKFWSQMLQKQKRDVWLKITIPVLILHAEGDTTVPYSLLPKAKRELNRAGKGNFTWTFLEGGDHDLITSDVFLIADRWIRKKAGKTPEPDDE